MNTLWSKYPFLRYFLIYLAGTFSYHCTDLNLNWISVIAPLSIIILCYYLPNKLAIKLLEVRIFSLFYFFFAFANYNNASSDLLNKPNHIYKLDYKSYFGQISSDKTEKSTFKGFTLTILLVKTSAGWKKASGKVIIYLPKKILLEYSDYLFVQTKPSPIKKPTNPGQFNYASYLSLKNIYHRHYLAHDSSRLRVLKNPDFNLLKQIYRIRDYARQKIKTYVKKDIQNFASSLLLGLRSNLEDDIKVNFRKTGVFHVLAISGLHVGIIYGLLITLFSFLKYRKPVLFILIVGATIWFYAFFSGLSISVTRAACMFSFLLGSLILKRQTYNFNSLALSALVILAFRPFAIFEVGFQSSYTAVASIFIFMPLLKPYFYSGPNPILKYVSELVKICLSAQTGLLPLMLYYFHQFPTYFLIANVLIIPLITIALLIGLLFLTPLYFEIIDQLFADILSFILCLCDYITTYLVNLPGSTIDGFNPTIYSLIISYLALTCFILFWNYRKIKHLMMGLILLLALNIERFVKIYHLKTNHAVVVYDTPWPGIALIEGNKASIVLHEKLLKQKKTITYNIKPYFEQHNFQTIDIRSFEAKNLKFMRAFGKNRLLIHLDKKILYLEEPVTIPLKVDYLILANPKIDLKNIDYQQLIIYNAKTPVKQGHSIRHEGAWVSRPLIQ